MIYIYIHLYIYIYIYNKYINTYIYIYNVGNYIKNYWLGLIFFSIRDSHRKGFLFLLHPSLEGLTEIDADPERRLPPPAGRNTREQLARGHFFEGLQNYMEDKSE